MRVSRRQIFRILVTTVVVILALFAARWLWRYYQVEPWTRDARVRVDVVQVAPDVSGLVAVVNVRENQVVTRGQVLFVIDRSRFELALAQAEANLSSARATLVEAKRVVARDQQLGTLVAMEARELAVLRMQQAQATLDQAVVARDTAALNLERTAVRASVNGVVTNFELRPGDYATAGRPIFAVVDSDSFHVDGYFEETKLPQIQVGDAVSIRLMGQSPVVQGHVASIAAGIEDRERSAEPRLLPNVNPTFSWVRLPQRIPVRIEFDHVPPDVLLVAGRTATVTVHPSTERPRTQVSQEGRP